LGASIIVQRLRTAFSLRLRFLVMMGGAAGLSLVRGFILAVLLDVEGFGTYAIVASVGLFASNILSFGRIEGFMKSFPRLWMEGQRRAVVKNSDRALFDVSSRAIVALIVSSVFIYIVSIDYYLEIVFFVILFSLASIAYNIYSSGIRSTTELRLFGFGNLVRAATAIAFGVLGAWLAGWPGAVVGEIVAAAVAGLLMRHWLVRLADSPTTPSPDALAVDPPKDYGGYWIFLSIILVSAPLYLDRLFVGHVFGAAAAGSYAFVLLFYMINSTIVAIIVQSVGPQLVMMERSGATLLRQVKTASAWSAACIFAGGAQLVVAAFAVFVWPLDSLGDKYGVTVGTFVAISFLSFFRVSEFFDWLMISRDREKDMTTASALFFATTVLGAGAVIQFGLSLEQLIWLLALARGIQLAAQLTLLFRHRSR